MVFSSYTQLLIDCYENGDKEQIEKIKDKCDIKDGIIDSAYYDDYETFKYFVDKDSTIFTNNTDGGIIISYISKYKLRISNYSNMIKYIIKCVDFKKIAYNVMYQIGLKCNLEIAQFYFESVGKYIPAINCDNLDEKQIESFIEYERKAKENIFIDGFIYFPNNNIDVLKYLIGIDKFKYNKVVMLKTNNMEIIKYLVNECNITCDYFSYNKSGHHSLEKIKYLVDEIGLITLDIIISVEDIFKYNNNLEILKYLYEKKIMIRELVYYNLKFHNLNCIKYLVGEKKCDVRVDDIVNCIVYNNKDFNYIMEYFIDELKLDIDIGKIFNKINYRLDINFETFKYLINRGQNNDTNKILIRCCEKSKIEFIKYLLDFGVEKIEIESYYSMEVKEILMTY